jgi:hypothetical protein
LLCSVLILPKSFSVALYFSPTETKNFLNPNLVTWIW